MSSNKNNPPHLPYLDPGQFRRVCGLFATGITVATVKGADGKPHGLTVNSFTSVSLNPPLVLICIGHRAGTHGSFSHANSFAINILKDDQQEVSARFASSHPNRFEGISWETGIVGAPVLSGALGVLECDTRQKVEAGDHTILIGEVRRASAADGRPLLYFSGKYRELKGE